MATARVLAVSGSRFAEAEGTDASPIVNVFAFAPEKDDSTLSISGKCPLSVSARTIAPVSSPNSDQDFVIRQEKTYVQLAADAPEKGTKPMAAINKACRLCPLKHCCAGTDV